MTRTAVVAPGGWPVIGHAWPMMRDPVRFTGSLAGLGDLVEVRLGPVRALVPCHPDLLWQVLTDDRVFDKGGPFFDRVRATIGNGVGSCPHAQHRRQRRLIQPAFHHARLARYAEVMGQEAAALASGWRDGQVVDVYPALFGAALRTALRCLFTTRADDAAVDRMRRSVETLLHQITARMFVPGLLQRLPVPVNRRFDRALADLRRDIDTLVADYRRGDGDRGDLLSSLLSARDEDGSGGLDDAEIGDQVLTMLVAGSDSVAATVSWALHLLDRHPDAMAALRDEVAEPARRTDLPRTDLPRADLPRADLPRADLPRADLPRTDLPRTGRVITEALRLYPPGWLFTRITTEEVELGGRRLPAGTTLAFCPSAVHLRPDVHDRPDAFDPDRWLPERTRHLPRGAFVAFGGGARKCAGQEFGLTESSVLLATLLSRWRLRAAAGSDTRPVALSTALRPRRLLLEVGGAA
ncbi:cytochrome P450 [Saccharothrix variisporea]|uniref:Pentalenene oxygenase n=1 Tax=Saccharothrix variisporea TaxID=543527 RepID=A0A495XN82_9PSEU|nr:cytochrome P450 [Saccharothrix variisporea]RKT74665.1 pentalenene oxygenase [Saccharothrix variisporea]